MLNLTPFNAAQQFEARNKMGEQAGKGIQDSFQLLSQLLLKKRMEDADEEKAYQGLNEFLASQDQAHQNAVISATSNQATNPKQGLEQPKVGLEDSGIPTTPAAPAAVDTRSELEKTMMMKAEQPVAQVNMPQREGLPALSQLFQKTQPAVTSTAPENAAPEEESASAQPATTPATAPATQAKQYVPKGQSKSTYGMIAATAAMPTSDRALTQMLINGEITMEQYQALRQKGQPQTLVTYDENGRQIVVPKQLGYTGGVRPQQNQILYTIDANNQLVPVSVNKAQQGPISAPEGSKFVVPGQLTAQSRAAANANYQFDTIYDPAVGHEVKISKADLANRIRSGGQTTYTPADAKRVQPALGMVPEVYNTIQNTRDAAKQALAASPDGQLHFKLNNVQLAEMAATMNHHKSALDSSALQNYLTALVNEAADEPTRNYVNNLKTMYEALQPMRGIQGVKGAQSDTQYLALLAAAPGPQDVFGKDIEGKLQRLENSVALSTSSLPNVPGAHGYTLRDINADMMNRRNGLAPESSVLSDIMKFAHNPGASNPTPAAGAGKIPQTAPAQGRITPGAEDLKNLSTEELLRRL